MIKQSKKRLLINFVENKCEICNKIFEDKELHIHRIRRNYQGGTYDCFRNLQVLCVKCHKKVHENDFTSNRT